MNQVQKTSHSQPLGLCGQSLRAIKAQRGKGVTFYSSSEGICWSMLPTENLSLCLNNSPCWKLKNRCVGEHACMNTHMYAWVQYTSQRLMCCHFSCTRCSVTGSLISLVARELQGCFSPPLLPSLGETNADKQAQLFLCRFGGSNSGPHPCKQALYHLSFLSSLKWSSFSPSFHSVLLII